MYTMKRVAVCVSGHLRAPKLGYELLKRHVIDPNPGYQFDFFIDTWSTRDWRKNGDIDRTGESLGHVISDVISFYKPIVLNVQRDREWNTDAYIRHARAGDVKKKTNGEHILGMYYKIMKCDEIRRNHENELNFQYDLVFRHRTDVSFKNDLVLSDTVIEQAQATIFVAKNHSEQQVWCSDVSAFSRSKGMTFYSRLFKVLHTLVESHSVFRPEPLLYHHLMSSSEFKFDEFFPDWYVINE